MGKKDTHLMEGRARIILFPSFSMGHSFAFVNDGNDNLLLLSICVKLNTLTLCYTLKRYQFITYI